jgi:hypothetical protein
MSQNELSDEYRIRIAKAIRAATNDAKNLLAVLERADYAAISGSAGFLRRDLETADRITLDLSRAANELMKLANEL